MSALAMETVEREADEGLAFDAYETFDCVLDDRLIEHVIDWAIRIRQAAYLAGFTDGCKVRS